MKKFFLIAVSVATWLASHTIQAQDNAFDKGTVVVTGGVGIPNLQRNDLRLTYHGYNSYSVGGFGPLLFKGDYGLVKFKWGHSVGVGAVIGFSTYNVKYTYSYWHNSSNYGTYQEIDKYKSIAVGARGTYHFFTKEKFDIYASVGVGFIINTSSQTTTDPSGVVYSTASLPGLYEAGTVGIRYFFTKNFGVYSEIGWDMSAPIQGGVALKF